jgi:hypothetical protein
VYSWSRVPATPPPSLQRQQPSRGFSRALPGCATSRDSGPKSSPERAISHCGAMDGLTGAARPTPTCRRGRRHV